MGNEGEQHDQESGNPDEKSRGELWGLDFFFVHMSGYAFGNSCQGRKRTHSSPTHVYLMNIPTHAKSGIARATCDLSGRCTLCGVPQTS